MTYLQRVGCSFRYYRLGLGLNLGRTSLITDENAIRPFCDGRRNWLFSDTPEVAQASATIYSLIESAKANAPESYNYLRYLFEKLPFAKTAEDYKKLLLASLDLQQLENAPKVSLV